MIALDDTGTTGLNQTSPPKYYINDASYYILSSGTSAPFLVGLFKRTNRRPVLAQVRDKRQEQLKMWGLRK